MPDKFSNDKLQCKVEAKTEHQKEFIRLIHENTYSFGLGCAGTGKTLISLYLMCRALVDGDIEKIFLTKPFVETGKGIGHLPGTYSDKTAPYLVVFDEFLDKILGPITHKNYVECDKIEILPMEYIRGRTLGGDYKCMVLLDDGQNATKTQILTVMTRLGPGSKMIVTGDTKQIDLYGKFESGLQEVSEKIKDIEGVGIVTFDRADVQREKLIGKILEVLEC